MNEGRHPTEGAASDLIAWDQYWGSLFSDLTMLNEDDRQAHQRLAEIGGRDLDIARHIRSAYGTDAPSRPPLTMRDAIDESGFDLVRGYGLARSFVLACGSEGADVAEHPFWQRAMAVAVLSWQLAAKHGQYEQWALAVGLVAEIGYLHLLRSGQSAKGGAATAHDLGREFVNGLDLPLPLRDVFDLPPDGGLAELVGEASSRATTFGYHHVGAADGASENGPFANPTRGLKSAQMLRTTIPSLLACAGIDTES